MAILPSWLVWDWHQFWPQLGASLIALGAGIPLAFLVIRHELSIARKREFEGFQTLAQEVLKDFAEISRTLLVWSEQMVRGETIRPIDPPTLTWEIEESQLRFIFASRGVHHVTETAVAWYRNDVETARGWNEALRTGTVTDDIGQRTFISIQGAHTRVSAAQAELVKTAKLGDRRPSGVRRGLAWVASSFRKRTKEAP